MICLVGLSVSFRLLIGDRFVRGGVEFESCLGIGCRGTVQHYPHSFLVFRSFAIESLIALVSNYPFCNIRFHVPIRARTIGGQSFQPASQPRRRLLGFRQSHAGNAMQAKSCRQMTVRSLRLKPEAGRDGGVEFLARGSAQLI